MNHFLRAAFFLLVVRPLATIILGLNVRCGDRLPRRGPAILVANHNSHLDTMVLMSLFPLRMLPLLRPVAAADYFLRTPLLAWFALRIIGIIPLDRQVRSTRRHPLAPCTEALERGEILILFPEGTRGEPEELSQFKSGVAHVAKTCPDVPLVPIYMHGLGKALPRGEALLVPCICDVNIGTTIAWPGDKAQFMLALQNRFDNLAHEMKPEVCSDEEEDNDETIL